MSEPIVLPVVQGDWVARDTSGGFVLARVRQSYEEDGQFYADLVPHNLNGERIGRQSPACGGPRAFEPWCSLEGWTRIETPHFPLKREMIHRELGNGKVVLDMSVIHDGSYGAKVKAFRTEPKKQSGDRPRTPVFDNSARLREALRKIEDGHNDPRALAREALGRKS